MWAATACNRRADHAAASKVATSGNRLLSVCTAPLKLTVHGAASRGAGRRRHQAADQVVRRQVDVDFIAHPVRCLAAEVVHLEHDLETAQVQFRVPPAAVQLGDRRGGELGRVEQAGHDHDRSRAEARLPD